MEVYFKSPKYTNPLQITKMCQYLGRYEKLLLVTLYKKYHKSYYINKNKKHTHLYYIIDRLTMQYVFCSWLKAIRGCIIVATYYNIKSLVESWLNHF